MTPGGKLLWLDRTILLLISPVLVLAFLVCLVLEQFDE